MNHAGIFIERFVITCELFQVKVSGLEVLGTTCSMNVLKGDALLIEAKMEKLAATTRRYPEIRASFTLSLLHGAVQSSIARAEGAL